MPTTPQRKQRPLSKQSAHLVEVLLLVEALSDKIEAYLYQAGNTPTRDDLRALRRMLNSVGSMVECEAPAAVVAEVNAREKVNRLVSQAVAV